MSINKNKRERVFAETQYRCAYCGQKLTEETRTIDHIIPKKRGGTDSIDNLVSACTICNNAKGEKTPDEYRESLKIKISDMKQKLYSKKRFYYEKQLKL